MFDIVQIICWSITYVLIIVAGIIGYKDRKVSMPYVAGILNFSWELCALLESKGFWGHTLWLLLDVGIVLLSFRCIQEKKKRVLYVVSVILAFVTLKCIFLMQLGMLFSVFVIDLIMAAYFLIERKKLSGRLKIPIAFMKLLGDIFAGVYYAPTSKLVGILALLVFFCNTAYLCLCIGEIEAKAGTTTHTQTTE